MEKKIIDLAKEELAELERRRKKILAPDEVKKLVLSQAKLGRRKITKHRMSVAAETIEYLTDQGIKVINDYVPKNFIKRLLQKLLKIKCVRFDWDDEEEQDKKKKKEELQLLQKQIEELTLKLSEKTDDIKTTNMASLLSNVNKIKEEIVI